MAIRQYNVTSLYLDDIEILFENLSMIDNNIIKNVITTKKLGIIQIIPNILIINTSDKSITIVGYKINKSKYMLTCEGRGDTLTMPYKHSDEYMLKAIQKLYEAYTDYILSNSFNEF